MVASESFEFEVERVKSSLFHQVAMRGRKQRKD